MLPLPESHVLVERRQGRRRVVVVVFVVNVPFDVAIVEPPTIVDQHVHDIDLRIELDLHRPQRHVDPVQFRLQVRDPQRFAVPFIVSVPRGGIHR
jgi:hypothetical protein